MFGRHSRVYSRILLAADIGAGIATLFLAYSLRSLIHFFPLELSRHFNPELLPFREYLFYFLVFLPVWTALLLMTQRYDEVLHLSFFKQASRLAQFALSAGFLMGFLSYTFQLEVSRPILFMFLAASILLLPLNRALLHWVLRSRNINEHNQINILIVGTSPRARRLGRRLEQFRRWGFQVIGHLSTSPQRKHVKGLHVLGSLEDLPSLLKEEVSADEIIFVGSDLTDLATFEEMFKLCEDLGIRTRVAADFFPNSTSRVSMDFLQDLPFITFETAPDHSIPLVIKRAVDFVVAAACLAILSPLIVVTAVAVKLTSPGPVFYRQKRCGLYGRKFTLVKFRTMIPGAEDRLWEIKHLNEMDGPVFKMRNDPRVTPLGRLLRKFSVDEIPQFWNVMKGEMSLVGPRAPLPEEVAHYSIRQRRRLSVKPGITCLWQVSGRSEIDFEKWMDLDLHYIDNWSLWLDFRIMLRTIPAVFTGRGAR